VAPYVCAGVFFALKIALNSINPDDLLLILEILTDSSVMIQNWTLYEGQHMHVSASVTASLDKSLQCDLPSLYLRLLLLIASILHTLEGTRLNRVVSKLTSKATNWKYEFALVKDSNKSCNAIKDRIEKKLQYQKEDGAILDWISKGCGGISHGNVCELTRTQTATQEGNDYHSFGQWLFKNKEYKAWARNSDEDRMAKPVPWWSRNIDDAMTVKPVLWLKGTVGTGKTTLMCRVISSLLDDYSIDPFRTGTVVYYYCSGSGTGSTRPTHEMILRTIIREVVQLADNTVASEARQLYADIRSSDREKGLPVGSWESFLKAYANSTRFPAATIVIDALDECDVQEWRALLVFLGRLVSSQPRIRLMLSSQMHIPVSDYFLDALLTVQTSPLETYGDMRYYIETEISRLQKDPFGKKSILYKDAALRERLEKALQEHANGMFRWVSIWISIFYPPERFHPLRTRKEAEAMLSAIENQRLTSEHSEETVHKEKLKLLDDAYGRLYDMTGHTKSEKEYKVRAYRVVLCCYEPLTLSALAEAVSIEPDGTVNNDIDDSYIRDLCHNFLIEGPDNLLGFAHESARLFLEAMRVRGEHRDVVLDDFSDRFNHLEMARICLRVMGDSAHQIWANNGMRPAYWAEKLCEKTIFQDAAWDLIQQPDQIETGKLLGWHGQVALLKQPHFAVYVFLYFLMHCHQAQMLSSTTAQLHSELISVLMKTCSAFRGWALYIALLYPLLYGPLLSISEPIHTSLYHAARLNESTRCSMRGDVNILEPNPLLILSVWNLFDCLNVSQYISDVTMGPASDMSPSSV